MGKRLCTRRWRLVPPMYEVRGTMYDLGSSRAERECGEAKAVAELWSDRRTVAPSGAYVRCTMYDGGRQGLPGGG